MRYFFVLGKNPTLSTAEITSVLNNLSINYSTINVSLEVFVIDVQKELNTDLIKRLGGTIKIGIIIEEASFEEKEDKFYEVFTAENLIKNFLPKTIGKIHIGISIYDGGANQILLSSIFKRLKALNILVKDNLKEKGFKVGFVQIKERFLSSVSVAKNQLLTHGAEIVLIPTPEKILVGKTSAVQEFASFSFRDYGRPQRDKRSGLMPPKLARMMLNLAQVNDHSFILDPFCGSGTILQESILLGYKNIYVSDISDKAISDTKTNIDWLFNNFRLTDRSSCNIKIISSDVRSLSETFPLNSIDAIITEPYLGPPLFKKPDINLIKKIFIELALLYLNAFAQFPKILKPKGKIVIIFPVFEEKGNLYFLEILAKIQSLGFTQKNLLPTELKSNSGLKLTQRNTILYSSKGHFVLREIIIFEKN